MVKAKRRALVLALTLAIMITGLLFYYLKIKTLNVAPLVDVVVASNHIPANVVLSEQQLKEVKIPAKFVIADSIKVKAQLIGKVTKDDISVGEQIVPSRLVQVKEDEGLSGIIPEGFRAVSLNVDQVAGVNQEIKKGDLVDILVYLKPPQAEIEMVKTIFQRIEVVNAGADTNKSGDRVLILCMTLDDAEKLFLADVVGRIRLTLRPHSDDSKTRSPGITINSLR